MPGWTRVAGTGWRQRIPQRHLRRPARTQPSRARTTTPQMTTRNVPCDVSRETGERMESAVEGAAAIRGPDAAGRPNTHLLESRPGTPDPRNGAPMINPDNPAM